MEIIKENPVHKLLTDEKLAELDAYIESLDDKEGMLIHILHKGQSIFGYLPRELQLHIPRKIRVPASKVFGVVSFYHYFTETRRGEHTISVCMGTACFVKGAEAVRETLKRELKIGFGETTEDNKFTLNEVRCIGACGLAPALMVDGKVFGHMTEDTVKTVINTYRGE